MELHKSKDMLLDNTVCLSRQWDRTSLLPPGPERIAELPAPIRLGIEIGGCGRLDSKSYQGR